MSVCTHGSRSTANTVDAELEDDVLGWGGEGGVTAQSQITTNSVYLYPDRVATDLIIDPK